MTPQGARIIGRDVSIWGSERWPESSPIPTPSTTPHFSLNSVAGQRIVAVGHHARRDVSGARPFGDVEAEHLAFAQTATRATASQSRCAGHVRKLLAAACHRLALREQQMHRCGAAYFR